MAHELKNTEKLDTFKLRLKTNSSNNIMSNHNLFPFFLVVVPLIDVIWYMIQCDHITAAADAWHLINISIVISNIIIIIIIIITSIGF